MRTYLILLLLVCSISVESQTNSFSALRKVIDSEGFLFLDSLAYKTYQLTYADNATSDGYVNFIKVNKGKLNANIDHTSDEIFEISLSDLEALQQVYPNGYRNKKISLTMSEFLSSHTSNLDEAFKKLINKYIDIVASRKFQGRYGNSLHSSIDLNDESSKYTYQANCDLATRKVFHQDNFFEDYKPREGFGNAYGYNMIYTKDKSISVYENKNQFTLVESDFAISRRKWSADVYTTLYCQRSNIYSDAYLQIQKSDQFGSIEFSFARLWYWVIGDKVFLQFDKSLNSMPFSVVLKSGNAFAAEVLLDHGADLNYRDEDGLTYLMEAAFSHRLELCDLLLNQGISIDARDDDKNSALNYAVIEKSFEVTDYLLEHNASLKGKNIQGKSLFKLAYKEPRYFNNVVNMYRPARIGFWLIDFGMAGNVLNANNSGTYSAKFGPFVCQHITKNINIRHEFSFAWSQIDIAASTGQSILVFPDEDNWGVNSVYFTQLGYNPMLKYNKIPHSGVFMYYGGVGPGISKVLSKQEGFEDFIGNVNVDFNISCGVEAYSNKVGFVMEMRYSRDLNSLIVPIDIKRNMIHFSLGFMF